MGRALLYGALAALAALFVLQVRRGAELRPGAHADAPQFSLLDVHARRLSLASLRGRPVLLSFWATWCGPCRTELPELEALSRERPCGLAVVGITLDAGSADGLAAFALERGVTYPLLLDDGTAGAAYGVVTIPHSVLIDAAGRELGVFRGPVTARGVKDALRC